MTPRRIFAYGLAATSVVALLAALPAALSAAVDLALYDVMLRAAGARPPSGRVAIVAVDDRSLTQVGQWPWPRNVIAALVERLVESGATVVALDMLLAEPDRFEPGAPGSEGGGTDAALARALGGGRVVVGYAFTFAESSPAAPACVLHPLDIALVQRGDVPSPDWQLFQASGVTCTLPMLSRAAGASGHVNAGPDRDGRLRRIPLIVGFRGRIYPSLALASVRRAQETRQLMLVPSGRDRARLTMDGRPVALDERGTMLVRFRGRRGSFPQVSATDVLSGGPALDTLRNRIVFVGVTALGAGDLVATPFDTTLPGIEVHAAAADTLLQGDFITTPPYARAYEMFGTILAGLAATIFVAAAGSLSGAALSVILIGLCWWGSATLVASSGLFLSPLFPMASIVFVLSSLSIGKLRHEGRRADAERGRRERAHQFAVQSLTSLVESRDGSTGRHARRTEEYARVLATHLARMPRFRGVLTPEYVDLVARVAPLHDIGKVGVRDAVLHKPGPLSSEELDEMRRHPGFGRDTIEKAEQLAGGGEALLRVAKEMIYTHHERWDGKGYPRGLKGEEIPIAGRIMALVDAYDALIDSRAYRSGVTHEEAVSIIRAGRGTHFDPDVVDAFVSVEGDFRRLADELRGQTVDR